MTLRGAASTESGLKHQYLFLKKRKKSMNMLGGTVLQPDFIVYVN